MSESTVNALLPAVAALPPAGAAGPAGRPASDEFPLVASSPAPPRRRLWRVLIVVELLLLGLLPWAALRYVYVKHIYNFHVVDNHCAWAASGLVAHGLIASTSSGGPDLLRCGQLSESGLDAAIRAHGVRTVINLRYGAEDPEIGDGVTEKDVCDRHGVRYVYMPVADVVEEHTVAVPRKDGSGRQMLVPWCVADFLKIMDDPANRPVLVHCRVGKHRTGILSAIWQLEQLRAGASVDDVRRGREKVIAEMMNCGFLLDDRPVYWKERAFVETYQPRSCRNSDLILPYLDRTVDAGQVRPAGAHAPREQRPFDETEPAGNSRGR